MTSVGSESTRLVILRGDAASGKTTTALALRDTLGSKVALIHQDYFRREILVNDDSTQRSGDAGILIVGAAREAMNLGYDVILDGIFNRATTRACGRRPHDGRSGDVDHRGDESLRLRGGEAMPDELPGIRRARPERRTRRQE